MIILLILKLQIVYAFTALCLYKLLCHITLTYTAILFNLVLEIFEFSTFSITYVLPRFAVLLIECNVTQSSVWNPRSENFNHNIMRHVLYVY